MGVRRDPVEKSLTELGVASSTLDSVQTVADKQKITFREAAGQVEDVDPLALAKSLSKLSGLPVLEQINAELIESSLVKGLPLMMAREKLILPLYLSEGQLVVGIGDLTSFAILSDLRLIHGHPIRPVLVPSDVLRDATNKAYDRASASASSVLEDVEDEVAAEAADLLLDNAELLDDPDQAPIIRFVNALVAQAIKERASDIHIEPFEKDLLVRYRVDGVLKETVRPPPRFKNAIVSRIKIMAGLNIAEKRLPQDGRIRRRMGGREIDLRVSTVPVQQGERVVLRILEKGTVFNLESVGMAHQILDTFRRLIRKPHGILLVSGPTGSGKSTTLYSAISEINSPDKNILTIENPVEYQIKGIGQVQVNPKIELTFASALRAFLRQDPDVILVGEIRDRETADNAVQASLTGHLVFSTIHTNDAAGAFARLTDMGVEPFLVASSLLGVLAQRLVRCLCVHCREAYTPTDTELIDLALTREQVPGQVYRSAGCPKCNNLGYRGRTGIYEFLPAFEEVKQLVIANADSGTVKRKAVSLGMGTLRDDGVIKVLEGVTSFDEVMRVTQDDTVET
ncbi:MAG: type II secretion system ATPase GspE [Proteobacteria bacterium]|jgi:general secretion pathway protein E|nr:type II secretion system ATPase GspE [Pseudomonadota bacterium]